MTAANLQIAAQLSHIGIVSGFDGEACPGREGPKKGPTMRHEKPGTVRRDAVHQFRKKDAGLSNSFHSLIKSRFEVVRRPDAASLLSIVTEQDRTCSRGARVQ